MKNHRHGQSLSNLEQNLQGRKLQPARIEFYLEIMAQFDADVVEQVCKTFAKSAKLMPTPDEIERECIALRNKWEAEKPPSPGDTRCKYESSKESQLSRELCGEVTADDLKCCLPYGWPPLCSWHHLCMTARIMISRGIKNSSAEIAVRTTLRDRKKMREWSQGELEHYLKNLGFDPFRNARGQGGAQDAPK